MNTYHHQVCVQLFKEDKQFSLDYALHLLEMESKFGGVEHLLFLKNKYLSCFCHTQSKH